jgi:hypothetical protein
VASISRFLDPADAMTATRAADVEIVDSRRFGGAYVLDLIWERLGIGAALRGVAKGRRLDPEATERVLFALVANRALEPISKLAATTWVAERVAIMGAPAFDEDAAYRAMDFLLEALAEIASEIFHRTANLLNLSCDLIFVDTSSTYFCVDVADAEAELDTYEGQVEQAQAAEMTQHPSERATRRFSKHSKDHRDDAPQVVMAMAVTKEGIPIRCWTFPGTTSDQLIMGTIKDDLAGWMLHRVVWVADSGFNSAHNRLSLQGGGGHYIVAERMRSGSKQAQAALARAGRYQKVGGNLEVKEVRLGDGARSQRFVVCHNPEVAARDRIVRANLASYLERRMAGSDSWSTQRRDELVGELRATPALHRLLRRTGEGKLRIDKATVRSEERFDGKFLLRCSDDTLSSADVALGYKQLYQVERGWRDLKSVLRLSPVFHWREDRIRAHIQLCWLALLLIRTIENAVGDTWRNIANELDRMHLVTLATADGRVAQRSMTTAGQARILAALELPEPARFIDFVVPSPRA